LEGFEDFTKFTSELFFCSKRSDVAVQKAVRNNAVIFSFKNLNFSFVKLLMRCQTLSETRDSFGLTHELPVSLSCQVASCSFLAQLKAFLVKLSEEDHSLLWTEHLMQFVAESIMTPTFKAARGMMK
jgi:hypothetical protein